MVAGIDTPTIQAVSSVVLAIFTVVLAVVTYLYYRQSRAQTNEMQKNRQLQYEPKLKAGLKGGRPNFEIGFVNIGGGIAQEVEAQYWIEGLEEYKRTFRTPIHFPEETFRLGFPVDDSEIGEIGMSDSLKSKIDKESDKLIVEWSYKDARDEVIDGRDEFSIFEQIQGRSESTEFYSDAEEPPRF